MNYRQAYRDLAVAFLDFGIVLDINYFGCAMEMTKNKIVICINPEMSWKHRLYTLAHEIGHYFRLEGRQLVRSKSVAREKRANQRAIKILAVWLREEDVSVDFMRFYNKAAKRPKPVSWQHLDSD